MGYLDRGRMGNACNLKDGQTRAPYTRLIHRCVSVCVCVRARVCVCVCVCVCVRARARA